MDHRAAGEHAAAMTGFNGRSSKEVRIAVLMTFRRLEMRINLGLSLSFLVFASQTQTAVGQTPGTFSATGNLTVARVWHSATLLNDGTVLIAGGSSDGIGNLASAELYDPSSGTFRVVGNMTAARGGHTATLLPNGTVLIAGGDNLSGVSAEIYDPATGKFTPAGGMIVDRGGHTATLLHDGRVLIAGGSMLTTRLPSAELYDPSTGAFTPTGSLDTAPYGLTTATLLADGRVLIASGSEVAVELYNPRTGTFSKTSPRTPWIQGSVALLMNGTVLLAGGNDDPGDSNLAEIFDPSAGTFTQTGNLMAFRADDPATLLPDGTVLIAGSNGDAGLTLASAELYDPASGTFMRTGDMTVDRGLHTATLLNNGKVLIAGGIRFVSGEGWPPLSSAELYTPLSAIPAPSLFSLSGGGAGQGAIWHSINGNIASASDPAIAGDVLSMYTNNMMDGAAIAPQVIVGGQLAEILYFGAAPGYPGYNQLNFMEPNGVAPGSAVPVRLTYIGRPSNEVTIGTQ
jgi:hypothetical protein